MPETRYGETVLTIGDRSRDNLLELADTSWDHNGTLTVTVRELVGDHCHSWSKPQMIRKMRDFARRAMPHPEHTRSARLVRTFYAESCDYATFAVSRLSNG